MTIKSLLCFLPQEEHKKTIPVNSTLQHFSVLFTAELLHDVNLASEQLQVTDFFHLGERITSENTISHLIMFATLPAASGSEKY